MEEDSNSESEEQSTMNMGFEKDMDDLSSERSGQSLSLPFFARFRLSIQLVETLLYMKSKNLSHGILISLHFISNSSLGYVSPSTIWVASDGSLKLTLPSMNLFYLKYLHPTLISTYLPPELSDYLVTKKNSISFYTLATMFKEQTDVYNVGLILYYVCAFAESLSVDIHGKGVRVCGSAPERLFSCSRAKAVDPRLLVAPSFCMSNFWFLIF